MIKKEITLCSKQVTLAYCFATEIGYKFLAEEDITDFMAEAISALQEQKMPDMRRGIYLILAAMQSYYDSIDQEAPVTDKDLMNEATPLDVGNALGTIIGLRSQFYRVPSDEPEDEKKDDDSKND